MTQLKVLVPLDGSKLAECSLAQLSTLRLLGDVELLLVSVVDETDDFHSSASHEAEQREHNVLSTYVNEVAADITRHLGLTAATRVQHGNPAEVIIRAAGEFGADLIIISSHGRSGFSRWRLGSVADKIIRNAPANVLVMGPRAAQLADWYAELSAPFPSILVPLDGSLLAEAALPVAQRYAAAFGSTLHLVRAVPIPTYGDPGMTATYGNLLDDLTSAAEAYLDSIKRRPEMPEKVETKVLVGSASAELLDYVEANAISLVAMTTHGRGGLVRAALGSVTGRLVGSDAPVLVVRAPEQ